jgi:flagellar biosynthetic protein FliR
MSLFGVEIWGGLLAFCRIGALVMLLPGFGEPQVSPRLRLAGALLLTVVLAPTLAAALPPEPATLAAGAGAIVWETLIGLAIGSIARILQSALSIAGQVAGFESGLSFAQTQDPTLNQGGALLGVFYGVLGATLVFASDLHLLLIRSIAASYAVFPPGSAAPAGAFAEWAVQAVAQAFTLGVRIAAPVIMVGMVFRVIGGVLSRLIPQIQIYFVALPLNVALGLAAIGLSLGSGALLWLERMRAFAVELR